MPRKQLGTQKQKKLLGVAIYFFTYSTWEGPVLYVEDLFVVPSVRGKLIGALLGMTCTQIEINVTVQDKTTNHRNSLKLMITIYNGNST